MIAKQELMRLRGEWQLDVSVIEKDYVLGWVLAAIAAESALADTWIFKGGTCLRKCYYETYRFSEDLDFTVVDGGPEEPDEMIEIFERVSDWLARETGIELEIDQRTFARRRNLRGQEIEREWENMLGHQLPRPLPPFEMFWEALEEVFAWLVGTLTRRRLRRAPSRDQLDTWRPPHAIVSWRRGAPLELIRYAGANRLKVEIDYRPAEGYPGRRLVEPYELRRTRAGNLVLLAVNGQGETRTYRIDRIAAARPTNRPFTPRYIVAF